MAQAQYDKFVELRKSGVDAKEARLQAYGEIPVAPIANAPVAGQAPAVPITPATVSNPQVPTSSEVTQGVKDLGGDVKNRQNTRNVMTGKGGTVTPSGAILNADGSVTPAPVETAAVPETPTATVSPTPTTPVESTAPVDKNAEIKAKNEAQMALNKQEAEQRQAERDKVATDASNALANNEGAILNTLKVGGVVPETVKTSPNYKNALNTYNKIQQYSSYSVGELTTAMNNGAILPGTSLYNEMMKDPTMKSKLTEAQIYTSGKAVSPQYEDVTQEIISNNPTTANLLSDGVITQDEWNQATNNTEVVSKAKDVEVKTNKYNTLMAEYDAIADDVKAQFPGSPFADSIIADRQKAKYKNVLLAKGEMDTANGTLTELKTNAANLFETNLKLYQQEKQTQDAYKMEAYKAKLGLATNQAEFEQKIAQQAQAMNNPTMAISSMIDEYKKLGIPFTRSTQQVIADFQSSGQDLPTYLSNLQKTIQSKPEYQKIQALQQGQMSDAQKIAASQNFEMKKMGIEQDFQMAIAQAKNVTNNKWTKLDDGLYTNENGEIMTSDELKTAKLIGNTYLQKQVGEEGGDCGFYASRATGMSSTPGGNSKEARTKAFSETTPQVGGMAFFGGAGYDPTYGHISIVTGVNADGTINVKDSNYNNDGKVTERTVPANTATGFYNNTPLAQGVSKPEGTQGEYTDQNINDLAYLVGLQEKNPAQAAKDMKELGYTARDLANYKAGNVPLTENQKNSSMDIMNAIKDLSDSSKYEWNDAVGKFDPSRIIGTQDAEDANMAINNLVAKLTLPNLGVLKGPMSDKDIQFIKEASSKLATTQSNDSFERNLIDAYNLAARRAGQPEIKKLSDLSAGTSSVGGEADYSKYE